MQQTPYALVMLLTLPAYSARIPAQTAAQIVQRSVVNTRADWTEAPQFDFTEHDVIVKNGVRTEQTYQVLMIDGSPYDKMLAIDGHPLSPSETAKENRKLAQEIKRRRRESAAARQDRIADYQKQRHQDHELMAQMVQAFDYQLLGIETVDGHQCFVLSASPRPGYEPINRETKVLKGMRGKLWIDTEQYQWVKVLAEVFRPVAFGFFIAKVDPGTEFILEQQPVEGNLWLPSHFNMIVKAKIFFYSRNSTDDETYTGYRRVTP